MSILIKGMDMPKNCTWCPCGRADAVTKDPMNDEIFNMFCMAKKDYWTCYRRISGKPIWCPLVEVKDKPRDSNGRFYSGMEEENAPIKNLKHYAPTVIESEE